MKIPPPQKIYCDICKVQIPLREEKWWGRLCQEHEEERFPAIKLRARYRRITEKFSKRMNLPSFRPTVIPCTQSELDDYKTVAKHILGELLTRVVYRDEEEYAILDWFPGYGCLLVVDEL